MKKIILFFSMASCLALSFVACSNDDDKGGKNDPSSQVTVLPTPQYSSIAQTVQFNEPLTVIANAENEERQIAMKGFSLTESGDAFFEIEVSNDDSADGNTKLVYVEKAIKSYKDGLIVLEDNAGTIQLGTVSRATAASSVSFSLTLPVPGHGYASFTVPAEKAIPAMVVTDFVSDGAVTNNLCRKWNVTGSIIDLEGDVTVYKEFKGCDLNAICEEAIKNGAVITAEERLEFDRVISAVDLSRTGLITIIYADGSVDAGDWNWLNETFSTFNLKLKDAGMGNKFFTNDTNIDVAFKDKRCTLKLSTQITGEKTYTAIMTLQLVSED